MTTFVPAVNVIQAAMRFTYQGQKVENVFHLLKTSAIADPTDFEAVGDILISWWVNEMLTNVLTNVSLDSVDMVDLTTQTSPGLNWTLGLPRVGSNSGTPIPNNVTFAVKWLAAGRGKAARGRTYHIGMSAEQCDGNQIDASVYAGFLAAYQELIEAFNTTAYSLVIVSRVLNKTPRATAALATILSASIDLDLDSQRRRLAGRGQ